MNEQERDKPKIVENYTITQNEWFNAIEFECPCCDTAHTYTFMNFPNYCDYCGQRLDWRNARQGDDDD